MRTLLEVLNLSTDYLKQKGIENPRRQAEELIGDALGIKRMQIYLDFERPLSSDEIEILRTRLARRVKGEPTQYIHGSVSFLGCQMKLNRDVLIPRQETEILADKIIQILKKEDLQGKILWDICTGSGCLGISIKKHLPQLKVVLSDCSENALRMASANAKLNGVEVELVKGNLLEPFKGLKAHFVVCNPPYVSESEYLLLDPEVRNFEPRLALVSGPTGLEFYQRLKEGLPSHLHPQAKVWFEIGATQGPPLESLFNVFPWKKGYSEADWSGKNRFFFLEIE